VATLRLFAQAREAAGCSCATVEGSTVEDVLRGAVERYGARLGQVIEISAIWVNGDFAELGRPVGDEDEIAVLPPVSGG
jgi:molybdopterin synthase sulfur carrier subunit